MMQAGNIIALIVLIFSVSDLIFVNSKKQKQTVNSDLEKQIANAYSYIKENSALYVFVIKKGTFADYVLQNNEVLESEMTREDAIEKIMCGT